MVARVRWAGALITGALILAGCGTGGTAAVDVTLDEWSVALGSSSASAGTVTFKISNKGEKVHELLLFQTDLAHDALPVSGGVVPEDAAGLTFIGEEEDIADGATAEWKVDLKAGRYVLLCNITDHYTNGMHVAFTVK